MRRAALVIAAISIASAASAADLPAASNFMSPEAPAFNAGDWYLRGDVGYSMPMRPSAEGLLPGGIIRDFDKEKLGKTLLLGAGVGYRFNNWLRADVTGEWRRSAAFTATNSASNYVDGYSAERARFSAATFLLNGYVDLGTWSGFTPYIGAGVGVSRKQTRDWTTEVVCFTALCAPSGPSASLPNSSKTGFTWALMAGTAIQLTNQLSLDLGYRFLNMGGMTTKADAFGVSAKFADVKVNEARLGLRYMFR